MIYFVIKYFVIRVWFVVIGNDDEIDIEINKIFLRGFLFLFYMRSKNFKSFINDV